MCIQEDMCQTDIITSVAASYVFGSKTSKQEGMSAIFFGPNKM